MADPTLPRTAVDTTYSLPTGNTWTVTVTNNKDAAGTGDGNRTDCGFQYALDNCARGDVIELTAATTYTVTAGVSLTDKGAGTDWIYIISSGLSALTEGARVTTASASNMPLINRDTTNGAAILCENNASYYRLCGLEIATTVSQQNALVDLSAPSASVQSNAPKYITIDRCYIHGPGTVEARRGIAMNGEHQAVIDSYLEEFWDDEDAQAIWGYNGAGPFKIHNCYLQGSGENVMFGGNDPSVTNLVPRDITITRCDFFKPTSWIGNGALNVKNLLEFKNAEYVLVEGCYFQNNWLDGQNGSSILLTPRNQNGGASWSSVAHITMRLCKLLDGESGFNFLNTDDANTSEDLHDVLVEDFLYVCKSHGQGGAGRAIQWTQNGNGVGSNVTIRHCTFVELSGETFYDSVAFHDNTADAYDNIVVQNNVFFSGRGNYNGWAGSGQVAGVNVLNFYVLNDNWTWGNNVVYTQNPSEDGTWPSGTWEETNVANINFVNYAGGDYSLSAGTTYAAGGARDASDGTDLGADIAAIEAAYANSSGETAPASGARSGIGVSFVYFR